MFLIRDIMYCKPGQVRAMVEKFKTMNKVMKKMGFGGMKIMTDVSAERYWTVVAETEAESLEAYAGMDKKMMNNKELQKAMKDYHTLVDHGRREIYTVEK